MKQHQIDRIKDLMDAKGVTLKELASKCGVSEMTVRRILTQGHNPTTDTVERIAEALGVHEQYIYEAEGESMPIQPVTGYIEYGGTIIKIKSFKQLEKICNDIKHDLGTPKQAKSLIDQDKENQKTQSKQPIDITTIDLFKNERYDTSKLYTWSFRKSDDEKEDILNDLGNMCQGYPFKVCGEKFLNSECAYISGMFSQNTPKAIEIQRELQKSDNGYEAKKAIRRKYEQVGLSRDDWNSFNVQWMLFVVWCKVTQNKKFAEKLRKIPSYAMIVENSTFQKGKKGKDTAAFWGMRNQAIKDATQTLESAAEVQNYSASRKDIEKAKMAARNSINHIGTWEGVNCMGKILTICKHCLEDGTQPPIDYELLRSKNIYLFGKLLTFQIIPPLTVIFDFDGTLVDTRPLDQYQHLFRGKERLSDEWRKGMGEYLSHIKDCPVYEGINDVIEYLRQNNINVCVVTAGVKEKVKIAAQIFGWKDVIKPKNIFGRHSFGMQQKVTKADANPMLFAKALEDMGIDASKCISFGNEIEDTLAAQKLGIKAYNCAWGAVDDDLKEMQESMPTITIESPTQIINILQSEGC